MNRIGCSVVCMSICVSSSKLMDKQKPADAANKQFEQLLDNYYEQQIRLFPLTATQNGDYRYNDPLPVDFTDSYRSRLKMFYTNYSDSLKLFPRKRVNKNEGISYDIIKRELEMNIERLGFHENYIPFNQFYALQLTMGQFGSGAGVEPFKTLKDYEE